MKLREYMEQLNEFIKYNPSALEMEVITAIDEEGNGYNPVYYGPTVGIFKDREFISSDDEDYLIEQEYTEKDFNAVCIN